MNENFGMWGILITVAWTSVVWIIILIIIQSAQSKQKTPDKNKDYVPTTHTLGGQPIFTNSLWLDTWYDRTYKIIDVVKFKRSEQPDDLYIIYSKNIDNPINLSDLHVININKLENQDHTWISIDRNKFKK